MASHNVHGNAPLNYTALYDVHPGPRRKAQSPLPRAPTMQAGTLPVVTSPIDRRAPLPDSTGAHNAVPEVRRAFAGPSARTQAAPKRSDVDSREDIHNALCHLKSAAHRLSAALDEMGEHDSQQSLNYKIVQATTLNVKASLCQRSGVSSRDVVQSIEQAMQSVAVRVVREVIGTMPFDPQAKEQLPTDGVGHCVEWCTRADVGVVQSSAAIHWDSRTVVHRWASRSDGRSYTRLFRTLASARNEVMLPDWVAVPVVASVVSDGVWFTVTWIPPLFSPPSSPQPTCQQDASVADSSSDKKASDERTSMVGSLSDLMSFALPVHRLVLAEEEAKGRCSFWQFCPARDDMLYILPTVDLFCAIASHRVEYLNLDSTTSKTHHHHAAAAPVTSLLSAARMFGSAINDRLVPFLVQRLGWFHDQVLATAVTSSGIVNVDWISSVFHSCGARVRSLLLVRALAHEQISRTHPSIDGNIAISNDSLSPLWTSVDSLLLSEMVARTLKLMVLSAAAERISPRAADVVKPVVSRSKRHVASISAAAVMIDNDDRVNGCTQARLFDIATSMVNRLSSDSNFLAHEVIPELLRKFNENLADPAKLLRGADFSRISLAVVIQHLEHRLGLRYCSDAMAFCSSNASASDDSVAVVVVNSSFPVQTLHVEPLLFDEVSRSEEVLYSALGSTDIVPGPSSSALVAAHLTSLFYALRGVVHQLPNCRGTLAAVILRGEALVRSFVRLSRAWTGQEMPSDDCIVEPAAATSSLFLVMALHCARSGEAETNILLQDAVQHFLCLANASSTSQGATINDHNVMVEAFVVSRLIDAFSLEVSVEPLELNLTWSWIKMSLAFLWCTRALANVAGGENDSAAGAVVQSGALGSRISMSRRMHSIDDYVFALEDSVRMIDDDYQAEHRRPPVVYRDAYRRALRAFVQWSVGAPPRSRGDSIDVESPQSFSNADDPQPVQPQQRPKTPSSVCSEELRRRHDDDEETNEIDTNCAVGTPPEEDRRVVWESTEIPPSDGASITLQADASQSQPLQATMIKCDTGDSVLPTDFAVYEEAQQRPVDVDRTFGRFVILPTRRNSTTQTKSAPSKSFVAQAPTQGGEPDVSLPRDPSANLWSSPPCAVDSDSDTSIGGASWAAFTAVSSPLNADHTASEQAKRRKRLMKREAIEFQLICNQDREARHLVADAAFKQQELACTTAGPEDPNRYIPPSTRRGLTQLKSDLHNACGSWKRDYKSFVRESVDAKKAAVLMRATPRELEAMEAAELHSVINEQRRALGSRLVHAFWSSSMEVRVDVVESIERAYMSVASLVMDENSQLIPCVCAAWDVAKEQHMAQATGDERVILRAADVGISIKRAVVKQREVAHQQVRRRRTDPVLQLDMQLQPQTQEHTLQRSPQNLGDPAHCTSKENHRELPSLLEDFYVARIELVSLFLDGVIEIRHAKNRFEQLCVVEAKSVMDRECSLRNDMNDSQSLAWRLLNRDYITETELSLTKQRIGNRKREQLAIFEASHRLHLIEDEMSSRHDDILLTAEKSFRRAIEANCEIAIAAVRASELQLRNVALTKRKLREKEAALKLTEVEARVRITWLEGELYRNLVAICQTSAS